MFGIDTLVNNITGFIETKIDLVKLDIQNKLSDVIAVLIKLLLFLLAITVFLMLVSITLAVIIGEITGFAWLGYVIVTILWAVGIKWLQTESAGKLLKKLTDIATSQLFDNDKKDGI